MAGKNLGEGFFQIYIHADVPAHTIAATRRDNAQGRIRSFQKGPCTVGRTVPADNDHSVITFVHGLARQTVRIVEIPYDVGDDFRIGRLFPDGGDFGIDQVQGMGP